MNKRIYYFTGTGNSMRAARVIANKLGETELISMRANPDDVPATGCDVIGFVYPVYHWTMPAPAVSFVQKLNIVNSVANYAIVYPPVPFPKFRVPKTEKKLRKIADSISKKEKRSYPKASILVRKNRDSKMGPYLELQKYADHPFVVSDECISCGLCTHVCPCNNLVIENGKPVFMHHCANCMACVVNCPKRAIGYDISAGGQELLKASNKKTPIVKIMGLPPKRKLYRNPYITASDLTKERE